MELSFPGYCIGVGVSMEEKCVCAVSEWLEPTSGEQLQRFLVFANFYKCFIRTFSSVAAPLIDLLKGK